MSNAPPVTVGGQRPAPAGRTRPISRGTIGLAVLALLVVVAVVNAQTVRRFRPPAPLDAAGVSVAGVGSSRYTVTADVRVSNPGVQPMTVVGLSSAGLAISARGGLPETVPAGGSRVLQMHLEIPACAPLPRRLGGFEVELARGRDRARVGYLSQPGSALYRELAALAERICGSYHPSD